MRIEIDCRTILDNTRAVVGLCQKYGIEVVGVTKGCCGMPEVARAMLAGGVRTLAESSLEHIRRLREGGIGVKIMLLALPRLSEADQVVQLAQVSLNSEYSVIEALSQSARKRGMVHDVILMVDAGDRREGLMPHEVVDVAQRVERLEGVRLLGLGAHYGCLGGVIPTVENTQLIVDLMDRVEKTLGRRLEAISCGGTNILPLVEQGLLPRRINQLRIGEAFLQAMDSGRDWRLPSPYKSAFSLFAEVVEVKRKPSLPEGRLGPDGFGRIPNFQDLGVTWRIILAGGDQYLRASDLRPKIAGLSFVSASSDYMVYIYQGDEPPVKVGDEVEFSMIYGALATGMASSGVKKLVHPLEG